MPPMAIPVKEWKIISEAIFLLLCIQKHVNTFRISYTAVIFIIVLMC